MNDIVERLEAVWKCRRCDCLSCDRGGAGELHDHVCTDGENCLETRDKLRSRRMAEAVVAQDASTEIKRLRAEVVSLRRSAGEAVAAEPIGCPTPGACSCPMSASQ